MGICVELPLDQKANLGLVNPSYVNGLLSLVTLPELQFVNLSLVKLSNDNELLRLVTMPEWQIVNLGLVTLFYVNGLLRLFTMSKLQIVNPGLVILSYANGLLHTRKLLYGPDMPCVKVIKQFEFPCLDSQTAEQVVKLGQLFKFEIITGIYFYSY